MKIILTPGHSTTDPGRVGPGGVTEREVVEDLARLLAAALARRMLTAEIMEQPAGEASEALQWLAHRIGDEPYDIDMVLSLHCAWADDPTAWGPRTLYLRGSEESRLLAECLLRRFPRTPWAVAEAADDPLLRLARCPAVTIEVDHLSHPEVAELMAHESWRRKVAENLVTGILAFIGPQDIRIQVDGREIYTDPAPQEVYNDVLVPVRVLGAALGAEVRWDRRRRVVRIRTAHPPEAG